MSPEASQQRNVETPEFRVDLREHVEALLRENSRALDMASEEREKAAHTLRESTTRRIDEHYERLHELLLTLFEEKDRALSMAASEREKAASVLRDEQHRAMVVAEKEREKSAQALREALARSIQEGDDRLREHIANQVLQINAALSSAERLSIERKATLNAQIDASTREFKAVQDAAQTAVEKAEEAQLRVNVGQNEFRGQLADQAAQLMPRKEVEALLSEMTRQMAELRDDLSTIRTTVAVGPSGLVPLRDRAAREDGIRAQSSAFLAAAVSVAAVVVAAAGILVAVLTH